MPVIKNCVYQETMVFHNGEVDFYQFRWQTNAFMFRQLRNPDEAASNQISSLIRKVCYAGRFNNDAWLIHWADDPYGTLYLFPDANETWDLPPTNSDEFAIYIGNSELLDTLAYGIYVNPATVKWLDESNFTGVSLNNGREVKCRILETSNGLPTLLEYHLATFHAGFIEEYKYDNAALDLDYFPNEILTYSYNGQEKRLTDIKKMLILKTSSVPLARRFFDPKTYFVPPPQSSEKVDVVLYTNGQELAMINGFNGNQFRPVLSFAEALRSGAIGPKANPPVKLIRVIFLSLIVLSLVFFYSLWQYRKKQQ